NMLLQILEEGKLTDNIGRVVNFRNTIILMTSNVGSETIKKQSTLGFSPISDENSYEKMREKILDEAKKTFRPEFLNRLDDVIVFRSLTKPDLVEILDLEINKVMERLKNKNIKRTLDEKAKDFLVEKGYDPNYGARPMRRSVDRFLEDPLAEEILKGNLHENDPIQVTFEKDRLVFLFGLFGVWLCGESWESLRDHKHPVEALRGIADAVRLRSRAAGGHDVRHDIVPAVVGIAVPELQSVLLARECAPGDSRNAVRHLDAENRRLRRVADHDHEAVRGTQRTAGGHNGCEYVGPMVRALGRRPGNDSVRINVSADRRRDEMIVECERRNVRTRGRVGDRDLEELKSC